MKLIMGKEDGRLGGLRVTLNVVSSDRTEETNPQNHVPLASGLNKKQRCCLLVVHSVVLHECSLWVT